MGGPEALDGQVRFSASRGPICRIASTDWPFWITQDPGDSYSRASAFYVFVFRRTTRRRIQERTRGGSRLTNRPRSQMPIWNGRGVALYLLPIQCEEWARGREELRSLNNQGGRPVAHIVATNRGARKRRASRKRGRATATETHICRGARRTMSPAVWQERRLYNGEVGVFPGTIYRAGGRRPRSLLACALVSPP